MNPKSTVSEAGSAQATHDTRVKGPDQERFRELRPNDKSAANFAHELRNPIWAIRNAVNLLESGGRHPYATEQARRLIARQVGQLSALVEDLLEGPLEATEVPGGPGVPVDANERPVLAVPRPDVVRGGLAAWQQKRVLDYIKNNLAEPIKVIDVASVTGLSPCHFARAFKRSFGLSVHLYLMRRRIELAQQLLVNSYDPLGEIALICGMHDQPHFTRWFRRLVGETPDRWRRAHRTIPFLSTIHQKGRRRGHRMPDLASY